HRLHLRRLRRADGSDGVPGCGDRHRTHQLRRDCRLRALRRDGGSIVIEIVAAILLLAGATFALLAAVGVLRMPDVFTRMQSSTKAATLGLGCLLAALALLHPQLEVVIRAVSIGAFLMLTTAASA